MNFKKITRLALPLTVSVFVFLGGLTVSFKFNNVNALESKLSSIENIDKHTYTYGYYNKDKISCIKNHNKVLKEDINGDGQEELIIWTKDIRDAYKVEVLRKENGIYVDDPKMYDFYFQKVVDYYELQLKKPYNSKSPIMWYYLADAQLKLNRPEDALKSIKQGRQFLKNKSNILDSMFLSLKGEALRRTENYNDALKTLDNALNLLYTSKFGDTESIINTYVSIAKTLQALEYRELPKEYYMAALNMADSEYGKDSKTYDKITYKVHKYYIQYRLFYDRENDKF